MALAHLRDNQFHPLIDIIRFLFIRCASHYLLLDEFLYLLLILRELVNLVIAHATSAHGHPSVKGLFLYVKMLQGPFPLLSILSLLIFDFRPRSTKVLECMRLDYSLESVC